MLLHWIWFSKLKKLSDGAKRQLLQHFSDPEEIYNSEAERLLRLEGVTEAVVDALEDKDLTGAKKILEYCTRQNIGILPLDAADYPARLRNTCDPPLLLYFRGTLPQWDAQPVVAIVGTRKATPYGLTVAGQFGGQIAASGGLVISGAAGGIDTAAMDAALRTGQPVVGVLGCGLDHVYPRFNQELYARVTRQGCLLTEYEPDVLPQSWHFPARNRIITGISNALLVVEAPEKSGAMISARLALEQGRDVFAVPGNVGVPACAGSNALLQDRAMPALCGWDVMRDYEPLWPDVVKRREVVQRPQVAMPQNPLYTSVSAADRQEKPENTRKKDIDKEDKSTYSV